MIRECIIGWGLYNRNLTPLSVCNVEHASIVYLFQLFSAPKYIMPKSLSVRAALDLNFSIWPQSTFEISFGQKSSGAQVNK